FPFQKPRHVQFVERSLYGGAAFIQYFGYLRDGIDNINPALVVLPLVLLGEGGTVYQQRIQELGGLGNLHFQQETGVRQKERQRRVCHDIISDSITSLCSG